MCSAATRSKADTIERGAAQKPTARVDVGEKTPIIVLLVSRGGVMAPGMGVVMTPAESGVKRGFEQFQDLLSAGRGRNMTRISLLAWRPKGVLWDAEEREYLTLQVREWHVEDLHGTRAFDQLVALREAEQP